MKTLSFPKMTMSLVYYHLFIVCHQGNNLEDLLAPTLRKYIEDNLGKTTLNKIEQRLIERHGIGVSQAIKDFSKLDDVLREFFGAGAQELESKFIQTIKIEPVKNSDKWIAFKELLVLSIQKSIEENLGKVTLNKIESRLIERYNINITQAIEDFDKLDDVLREFFGAGARGLESRFLKNIIKEESLKKYFDGLTTNEQFLAKEFLNSLLDKSSQTKLESLFIKEMIDHPLSY